MISCSLKAKSTASPAWTDGARETLGAQEDRTITTTLAVISTVDLDMLTTATEQAAPDRF